jgi:mRNA interferase RelE/StbE
MRIVFSRNIIKDIKKIDYKAQIRIKNKLLWFAEQKSPLDFAERLSESKMGKYRFRIGDYRVIFEVEKNQIMRINAIGHRREIYK